MIKQVSLKLLQQALNKAIHLDDSVSNKLLALEGKIIQMKIAPLQVDFLMTLTSGQIILTEKTSRSPDTVIESSPLGFIRLSLLPASKARSLFHDEVKLSGDIELGQQIKKLFDELDIDWEGHLAHFTGDVIAYQIGSWVRHGRAFQNKVSKSLCHNITEYLQEEKRCFPSQEELNDFYDDVDKLAADTERLVAQMNGLNQAPGTST